MPLSDEARKPEPLAEAREPVILQVLPALNTGGVERGTVEIAQALEEVGAIALVASSGGEMVRELERCGAEHITLPLATKNPVKMRLNAKRLADIIAKRGVDIVHARSRAPAWSALWACRMTGAKLVTTVHSPYGLKGLFKRHYNAVMTRGDRVIAISEFIRNYAKNNYNFDASRMEVIHRGVDMIRFSPSAVSAERVIQLANLWRIPDDRPVILLPGRLTRWKGHGLLLKALQKLKEKRDFLCLFVGPTQGREAYRDELERAIQVMGLTSHVAIFTDCRDVPAAYKLSDVVVSASIEPEGFGRVVSEGQALGKPVVVSNHGGGPEQVLPDETGFLFEPNDPDSLCQALEKALDLDSDARERLSQIALENVQAHFTTELMCRKTLQVYADLLRQT